MSDILTRQRQTAEAAAERLKDRVPIENLYTETQVGWTAQHGGPPPTPYIPDHKQRFDDEELPDAEVIEAARSAVFPDFQIPAVHLGPHQVIGLTAEATDHETVSLEWAEDPRADTYDVSQNGSIVEEDLDTNSAEITDLTAETTYRFRVRAVNEHFTGPWSDEVVVTTPEEAE